MQIKIHTFKAYSQVSILAFLVFSGLLLPIIPLHELGHKLACEAMGGKGEITGFNHARCIGNVDRDLMRFAGGYFGAMGCLVPWIFWRRWNDNLIYLGIIIGASTFGVIEIQKAVWEAVDYRFYISRGGELTFLLIGLVSAVMLGAALKKKIESIKPAHL